MLLFHIGSRSSSVILLYRLCKGSILLCILSLGFKYILHIIAGIFAFSIRNVKVDSLNDFRYVSTYVYISSILITLYIAFVLIAGGRPSLFAGVLIGLLLLEIIRLVFIPKVCNISLLYMPLLLVNN